MITMVALWWREWLNGTFVGAALNTTYVGIKISNK